MRHVTQHLLDSDGIIKYDLVKQEPCKFSFFGVDYHPLFKYTEELNAPDMSKVTLK